MDSKKNLNTDRIGYYPVAIHRILKSMLGDEAPCLPQVKLWVKRFRDGENELVDRPRPRAPGTGKTDENIAKMRRVLEKGRELTGREVAAKTKIPYTTAYRIFSLALGLTLKCARWIPKILKTAKNKTNFYSRQGKSS
jgi:hypothetical protein